ncbi:hypothetical protein [Spirosoma gilvum]
MMRVLLDGSSKVASRRDAQTDCLYTTPFIGIHRLPMNGVVDRKTGMATTP